MQVAGGLALRFTGYQTQTPTRCCRRRGFVVSVAIPDFSLDERGLHSVRRSRYWQATVDSPRTIKNERYYPDHLLPRLWFCFFAGVVG